jgi:5,10-methylenetetrahydrofolate reductase
VRLSELVREANFIRIVEVFPPAFPKPKTGNGVSSRKFDLALRFEQLAEAIGRVESIADAFSIPELKDDQRVHLNSVGVASELKRRTGNDIIPTLTLRDSNVRNLLGSISFAIFAGLENMLLVRGDPFLGEKNGNGNLQSKNVYDYVKVSSLVSSVRNLEASISSEHPICILSPVNLFRSSHPKYINTLKERELAGVDLFIAEQMFDDLESYLGRIRTLRKSGVSKPIIHSLFPLKNYEDAVYCQEKFGWSIPKSEMEQLRIGGPGYGLEMARRRYRWLLDNSHLVEGVSISTRGNPEVARFVMA